MKAEPVLTAFALAISYGNTDSQNQTKKTETVYANGYSHRHERLKWPKIDLFFEPSGRSC